MDLGCMALITLGMRWDHSQCSWWSRQSDERHYGDIIDVAVVYRLADRSIITCVLRRAHVPSTPPNVAVSSPFHLTLTDCEHAGLQLAFQRQFFLFFKTTTHDMIGSKLVQVVLTARCLMTHVCLGGEMRNLKDTSCTRSHWLDVCGMPQVEWSLPQCCLAWHSQRLSFVSSVNEDFDFNAVR